MNKLAPLSKWNEIDAVIKEHSQDGLTFIIVYNDATGRWRSYCKTKDSGYVIGKHYTSENNAYESCKDVYEEYYGTNKQEIGD